MPGSLIDNGSGTTTLTDVLSARAEQLPDQIAFTFEDDAGQTEQWTYRELEARARAIGHWLSRRAAVGERVLLVYPPGLEFIAAFFGSVYSGLLPVPATYPKPRRPLSRVDGIVADCQPTIALTHSTVLEGLSLDGQSPALAALAWVATDELTSQANDDFSPVRRGPNDLAFLQYTSGSTSDPRGVMVSHGNILHNIESIRTGFGLPRASLNGDRPQGVFWLPTYHDMGLVGGILTSIYIGATSHLFAPTTFLRRPRRWLELMSETGAQVSGAPNFGYELAIKKTSSDQRSALDLKNWQVAFCGAEPIDPATLTDFANALAPAGFRAEAYYPCYGMAEVTLLVSGGRGPAKPRVLHVDRKHLLKNQVTQVESADEHAQSLVGCGASLDGQSIRIVDPRSRDVCASGQVGEIWVRGQSVTTGYWNRDQLNQETFHATLADDDDDDGEQRFLRTGDLGFFCDGQLFITGRLKDVIIIRGSNHYPQDIERTARQVHEAVDLGAAFSVDGDRDEQLIVVHQVQREHRKADLDAVIRSIRAAVVDEHDIDPHAIVLIRPASLPITSSGKVRRSRCREQYLAGELRVSAEWVAPPARDSNGASTSAAQPEFLRRLPHLDKRALPAEVQSWLIAWLPDRANLHAGAVQPSTPFAELGIDSLTAVEISQEMDQILGLQLPPMVIWSCPTVEAMSDYLAEQLLVQRQGSTMSNGIV